LWEEELDVTLPGGYEPGVEAGDQQIDLRRGGAAGGLLAAIVAGSDDAIFALGTDGTIISWNPAAERLLGYTEDEIVGQHISTLIPESHAGEDQRILGAVLAGRRINHFETERLAKDGHLVDVSVTVSPLRDDDGTITGVSKIVRDISGSLEARRVQSRLAAIVENSDDAIIAKDATGIITSWNPAAERLFGYASEEAVGQPISMLLPPDLVGRERNILAEILGGSRVDHYETRRVGKDGRELHVSLTVSPIRDGDGSIVGASKIVRDVTEDRRLRAERALYAEQLAQANARLATERFKDQFLAMASHELRTPLTAISGFTKTMLDMGDRFTPSENREFLEIVDRQAERLTRLVDDLLLVSRLEADKLGSNPEVVEVADVIRDLLKEQGDAGVELLTSGGRCFAVVDKGHLEQMVSNLVSNARKYGEPPYRIDVARVGQAIEVRVRDHGEGLSAEEAHTAFERFARTQRHVDAQIPGTGLGLAIVLGLARAQGGQAWYESNAPSGACFALRFPAAAARVGGPRA
jgi:PAS domain S-box-containing protein